MTMAPLHRTVRPTASRLGRRPRQVVLVVALAAASILIAACEPTPVDGTTTTTAPIPAENGDLGWEGGSFSGASGSPSGSKPESKLWWNAGSWWADMWDPGTGDFYVHRLDLATRTWIRTPTRLDDRSNSRSDALWDGSKLYVASHAFAEGASTTPTAPSYLRRFSYQASTGTYTLDPGFPVQINDARSETLVIDKDSLGRIWATWTEDRQVRVAVSNVGGSTWGPSIALPATGSRVSSDDISSVVAFGGNRIGVLWSNQSDDTMYFAAHDDSAALGTWGASEVAYQGSSAADDHINLKNVTDENGRILAAVKTSRSGSSPLVHLLDRSPAGAWSSHVFGIGTDNHTRPIVVVDRQNARVQVFATSGQSGGQIYRKTAPLSNIAFPTGKGTAVLSDADSPDINNATSTKQAVDATTGLVVLATNDTTRRYWTHYDPLGGSPAPGVPGASFAATPTSGTVPLEVAFTDTSSGSPTSWAWEFGDGATSTARHPSHTYDAPGTYTVTLRATNASGTGTSVRAGLVDARAPTPAGQPTTFTAQADAAVKSSSPSRNYGTDPWLRTRAGDPEYRSYLRFEPTGLSAPPARAVLRLWVTDASKAAGTVASTSPSWNETAITWSTAPPPGTRRADLMPIIVGTWVEVDVTAAVAGNGPVAFVLSSTSTDSALFASREAANGPQLVVTPSHPK